MQPVLKRKLKLLFTICVISTISAIIYQYIDIEFVDLRSIYTGISLGVSFGILELFIITRYQHLFHRIPFFWHLILKTALYTIIISLVAGSLSFILDLSEGKEIEGFWLGIFSPGFYSLLIYTLMIYTLLVFYIQINRMLGEGVLIKFLWGSYYKPIEEDRIFMFLDMKSSTTVAERLGHQKYYALMDEFYYGITKPVLSNRAEIYQYVGDEVVFTWKTKDGIKDGRCVRIFFDIMDRLNHRKEKYFDKYGLVPEFKAAVHTGKVITAKIGDLKRVIVYNGDVVNTTSRMQELCNLYNCKLLISSKLLKRLSLDQSYNSTFIEAVKLRGKKKKIGLFCIQRINTN